MSKEDKIRKLANAVRRWRGSKDGDVWRRTPQPDAIADVGRWLERLGIFTEKNRNKLVGFKTHDEFNAWIKTI